MWGTQYIDELVQIGINDDPQDETEQNCETRYWALQDANYNVLGLVAFVPGSWFWYTPYGEIKGAEPGETFLKERYEYTPYGQRTVFKSAGTADPLVMSPLIDSQAWEVSSVAQPYGLCDVGHQGLFFDKEFGLYYNRARMMHPTLGRFLQRDPAGYMDGMTLYALLGANPVSSVDPLGLAITITTKMTLQHDAGYGGRVTLTPIIYKGKPDTAIITEFIETETFYDEANSVIGHGFFHVSEAHRLDKRGIMKADPEAPHENYSMTYVYSIEKFQKHSSRAVCRYEAHMEVKHYEEVRLANPDDYFLGNNPDGTEATGTLVYYVTDASDPWAVMADDQHYIGEYATAPLMVAAGKLTDLRIEMHLSWERMPNEVSAEAKWTRGERLTKRWKSMPVR